MVLLGTKYTGEGQLSSLVRIKNREGEGGGIKRSWVETFLGIYNRGGDDYLGRETRKEF